VLLVFQWLTPSNCNAVFDCAQVVPKLVKGINCFFLKIRSKMSVSSNHIERSTPYMVLHVIQRNFMLNKRFPDLWKGLILNPYLQPPQKAISNNDDCFSLPVWRMVMVCSQWIWASKTAATWCPSSLNIANHLFGNMNIRMKIYTADRFEARLRMISTKAASRPKAWQNQIERPRALMGSAQGASPS